MSRKQTDQGFIHVPVHRNHLGVFVILRILIPEVWRGASESGFLIYLDDCLSSANEELSHSDSGVVFSGMMYKNSFNPRRGMHLLLQMELHGTAVNNMVQIILHMDAL